MDSNIGTVACTVIKPRKAITACTAKGTHAILFLDVVLHGTWLVAVPESEEMANEVTAEIGNGDKVAIKNREPPLQSQAQ